MIGYNQFEEIEVNLLENFKILFIKTIALKNFLGFIMMS